MSAAPPLLPRRDGGHCGWCLRSPCACSTEYVPLPATPTAAHGLASVAEVAAWLAIVERTASHLEAAAAKGCLLVAYARAAARAEHRDEHAAALDALHYVRAAHGEDVATDAAKAAGLDLDALLDQEREDNAQRQRDAEWESCVPWEKS